MLLRAWLHRLLGVVPTLDLHGFKVPAAIAATDAFLREAAAAGEARVRIVYGKGRGSPGGVGVLRGAIPAWIEQNAGDRVDRFERELDRDGNDGAILVWLRARRDERGGGTGSPGGDSSRGSADSGDVPRGRGSGDGG